MKTISLEVAKELADALRYARVYVLGRLRNLERDVTTTKDTLADVQSDIEHIDKALAAHDAAQSAGREQEARPVAWAEPMQPVVVVDGVARFKENAIVSHLLDHGGINMNDIAKLQFSDADRMQFAQLIGYSVSGYGDLSYASEESVRRADALVDAMLNNDAAAPSAPASVPVSDAVRALIPLWDKRYERNPDDNGVGRCRDELEAALAGSAGEPSVEDRRQAHRKFWEESSSDFLYARGADRVFDAIEARARELAKGREQEYGNEAVKTS